MGPGRYLRPASSSAQSGLFPALPTAPIAVSVPSAPELLSVRFQPPSKPSAGTGRRPVGLLVARCFRRRETAMTTIQTTARSASRSTAGSYRAFPTRVSNARFQRGGFCRAATKQPASSGRSDGGDARAASIPVPAVAMLTLRATRPRGRLSGSVCAKRRRPGGPVRRRRRSPRVRGRRRVRCHR